jgi:DedD protein
VNSQFDLNDLDHDSHDQPEQDREISLGTSTILGIFFGLALVCALFFGLGYSMGRRSTPPTVSAAPDLAPVNPGNKPPSGSPAKNSAPPSAITDATPETTANIPAPSPTKNPDPAATKPTLVPTSTPTPIPAAAVMVQIAAVSHREDAENLLNALKQRGYGVTIRNEPQDKLLHVQIGPFPTRKDADVTRQRLLSDGYNAIVK